jgi:lipid II:glycine glycyltransferase (peptidoglycan interpeptide bridge formation enzyme)
MAHTTVKPIISESEWETFLKSRDEANFLQSWHYGELYKNLGKQVERSGFYEGSKLTGVMLSVVEKARRGTYLSVAGGPVIDWNRPEAVSAFVSEVTRLARLHSCVFVRVRPQLPSDKDSQALFIQRGFRDAPMHLAAELTSQIDLTKDEQSILQNMRKTTRYELKKAQKQDLTIRTTSDPEAIRKFYELQLETARRHGFVPFAYSFLLEQFRIFAARDMALLYSAFNGEELLAQAYIIFYGREAVYHYGASTESGRKFPGAYLIQWEAIREAKRRGMVRYNFWGVTKPEETGHRFFGVSVFKRGFGGQDTSYLHAQDLVVDQTRYLMNLAVESVRKRFRRL